MKRFIFLLTMTICIGVANASSSYKASHEVKEQTQIIQPPGCDFGFVVHEFEYCFCQESYPLPNVPVSYFNDFPIEKSGVYATNYLDLFRLCGMFDSNYIRKNYIHYSGDLFASQYKYRYWRQYTERINYGKQNYIHYSG